MFLPCNMAAVQNLYTYIMLVEFFPYVDDVDDSAVETEKISKIEKRSLAQTLKKIWTA